MAYHFGHPTLNTSADWISWRGDPIVTLRGYPGDDLEFCADGREAALPQGCAVVTLPAEPPAEPSTSTWSCASPAVSAPTSSPTTAPR